MDLFGLIEIPNWLIIICMLIGLYYVYFTWNHGFWEAQNIPVIKSKLLLIANFKEPVATQDLRNLRTYGKIYGLYEGRRPYLMIHDLEMIKTVLIKDFNSFVDRRKMPVGGKSSVARQFLTNLQGDEWRSARAVLTPTFTSGKLRQMASLMEESSHKMVKGFHQDIKKYNGDVNIKDRVGVFTMDVIASCCFSYSINSQDPSDPFIQHAKLLFNRNFTFIMLIIIFFPGVFEKLDISIFPMKCINFFENAVRTVVSMRRKDNIRRTDFLQLLLDAQDAEKEGKLLGEADSNGHTDDKEQSTDDTKAWKKVKVLSEQGLVANSILFLLAGFDTTATTVSFVVYLMALNPDCQKKLQKEIDEAFETHGKLNNEVVMSMPYLEKVLSETLRIFPPATRLERMCTQDYKLGDVYIRKDNMVAAGIYGIHHDPEIYPNPEVFDPERFSPENKAQRHPMAYLPFGTGPRICIGMRFALMEAKLAIAHFFKEFTVSPCAKTEIPLKWRKGIPMLIPENGITLKVEARK